MINEANELTTQALHVGFEVRYTTDNNERCGLLNAKELASCRQVGALSLITILTQMKDKTPSERNTLITQFRTEVNTCIDDLISEIFKNIN